MTVESIPNEWTQLSHDLIKDPDNFSKWCALIKVSESLNGGIYKKSSIIDLKLLRTTYSQFLNKFPLLEQYWVSYATWEFKLGNTLLADEIYEKSLIISSYSIIIWQNYLSFKIKTLLNPDELIVLFEKARDAIGGHYYSHEFYDLYLDYLSSNSYTEKYYTLLRRIIETPIYQFSKYFKSFFKLIENLNDETKTYIIQNFKTSKFSNMSLQEMKPKLKKVFTDLYITVQYQVYEIYYYERNIKTHHFSHNYLSNQELSNWDLYLNYIELKGSPSQIKLLYERCLLATAMYPRFWIRYANLSISQNNLETAKQILNKGIYITNSMQYELKLKLIDLELYQGNVIKSRDMVISLLKYVPDSIPIYLKFLKIEKIISDDEEYIVELIEYKLQTEGFDVLFEELVSFDNEKVVEIFKANEHRTSWIYWKSYLNYYLNKDNLAKLKEVFEIANKTIGNVYKDKLLTFWEAHLLDSQNLDDFYQLSLSM